MSGATGLSAELLRVLDLLGDVQPIRERRERDGGCRIVPQYRIGKRQQLPAEAFFVRWHIDHLLAAFVGAEFQFGGTIVVVAERSPGADDADDESPGLEPAALNDTDRPVGANGERRAGL